MKLLERLLAAVGAICGILVAFDTYVLKSKIANSLTLPSELPTGIFAITITIFSFLVWLSRSALSKTQRNLDRLEFQKVELDKTIGSLTAENHTLNSQVRTLQAEVDLKASLKPMILAVLATKETNAFDIISSIKMDPYDAKIMQNTMDVIGSLVVAGEIEGGSLSGNYRLAKRK